MESSADGGGDVAADDEQRAARSRSLTSVGLAGGDDPSSTGKSEAEWRAERGEEKEEGKKRERKRDRENETDTQSVARSRR